jgi:hypothetical protein
MESTHELLQSKVGELLEVLKKLSSNYKLTRLNIDIALHDTKNNKNFSFNIDEKLNFSMNSSSAEEQQGGLLLSDNTLSSGIFNTSSNFEDSETQRISISTSDFQSPITENENQKNITNSADIFKGGFKKTLSAKDALSDDIQFSSTSELNTAIKNVFTKQNGGKNTMSATSATSDDHMSKLNNNFSATSLSATSDNKVGGMRHGMSDTSFLNSDNMLSNLSATSQTNVKQSANMKGGFNDSQKIESTLSKMDLIRKKIRELQTISETEIFQKNVTRQSGGGNKNNGNGIVGINSSSTSSLCE